MMHKKEKKKTHTYTHKTQESRNQSLEQMEDIMLPSKAMNTVISPLLWTSEKALIIHSWTYRKVLGLLLKIASRGQ